MLGIREAISIPAGQSFRVLRWTRSLKEAECLLSDGNSTPAGGEGEHWHYHPEMELTLFSSGSGTRFVGDQIGSFDPGDLVLLGPDLPHYWMPKGESSGVSIQWRFEDDHPFWLFPETRSLASLFARALGGLRFSGAASGEVATLLSELTGACQVTRLGIFLRILSRLQHAGPEEAGSLSSRGFQTRQDSGDREAVTLAVRHLIARYREPVTLAELLEITRMSRTNFSRQFKHHSGHSFGEFLLKLRLQAACRLLKERDFPVLDTALDCGFTQISFFNRAFKRATGMTPREYRRSSRQELPGG